MKLKIILSILFLVTGYFIFVSPIPFFAYQRLQLSLSAGDRYFGRLQLWYLYARSGDWNKAIALESGLDSSDVTLYKSSNYPPELKKRLNFLTVKTNKTSDDWIELTKIQIYLNKLSEGSSSITQGHALDPIRSDLEKIYYQIISRN